MRSLRALHRQTDRRHDPGEGVGEHHGYQQAGYEADEARLIPKPHHKTHDDHEADHESVANEVRQCSAGQHRRTRHRQRSEPIDHSLAQIFGQAQSGLAGPECRYLNEQARQQPVDVLALRDRRNRLPDRSAEDVVEKQQEHDRLHRCEDQQLW